MVLAKELQEITRGSQHEMVYNNIGTTGLNTTTVPVGGAD